MMREEDDFSCIYSPHRMAKVQRFHVVHLKSREFVGKDYRTLRGRFSRFFLERSVSSQNIFRNLKKKSEEKVYVLKEEDTTYALFTVRHKNNFACRWYGSTWETVLLPSSPSLRTLPLVTGEWTSLKILQSTFRLQLASFGTETYCYRL